MTDITGFPSSIDGIAGIKLINEKFPQGTTSGSTSSSRTPTETDVRAAIEQLKVDALEIPGVSGPPVERLSADGDAALISFTMAGGRNDEANRAIVREVRTSSGRSSSAPSPTARMLRHRPGRGARST